MSISEARTYENREAQITYDDRRGNSHTIRAIVNEARFVPLYGPTLFANYEQIPLERVSSIRAIGGL